MTIDPNIPNILYFPWESSKPKEGWKFMLNKADHIFVTSYQLQKWVKEWGYDSDVLMHGIDEEWQPAPRLVKDKFIFLEVSQPRNRVDSQLAFDAFRAAFGDSEDYLLVMKSKGPSIVRYNGNNVKGVRNVRVIEKILDKSELVNIYQNADCLVHLSRAEGFSLAPFQQVATGGLTITTAETTPYADYLLPETNLFFDDYVKSDMFEHPGEILRKATLDEVVDKMRAAVICSESLMPLAAMAGEALREDFDWNQVIQPLVDKIEELT